jgi:hypothetical protein
MTFSALGADIVRLLACSQNEIEVLSTLASSASLALLNPAKFRKRFKRSPTAFVDELSFESMLISLRLIP